MLILGRRIEQDWADEEQRVQEVTAKLRIRITGLEDEVGKVQSDVVEIRRHYWDEITMDMSTTEDAAESIASMRQQAEVLSERERTHLQAAVALGKLKRLVNSLYFGRIDFKERDERQGEAIYLGIAGFLDEQEDQYRSTRELVEFTRGIVPGGDAIEPFTRSGAKPRVIKVSDRGSLHSLLAAEIDRLLGEGYASIAIITKTASESKLAHQALEPQLQVPLGLITKHSPTFESGVLVIPSYLAKGVEFDAVLIYDGSHHQYGHENERKLFYTACTRAMHELSIFSLGELNVFVGEHLTDAYEWV